MSIEARVGRTGPFSATQSELTVDMVGPAGVFGRLNLPQVKTSSSGADIVITDQIIKIIDMEAYKAFVQSLMQSAELVMRLENGKGTIRAVMVTTSIVYAKDLHLKGMNSLKTAMIKTEAVGDGYRNTMLTINPSPVEIDLGTAHFQILNADGKKIADQSGITYIARGESTHVVTGRTTGVASKGKSMLVGVTVEEDSWNRETIGYLNAPVTVSDAFVALCRG